MSDFIFDNGQKFNFANIKAGAAIDSQNAFLKKYDENGNSIFDANELENLKKDLEKYSGDNILDKQEAISFFAHVMNISQTKVKELFHKNGENLVYASISDLFEMRTKETAIEQIRADARDGMKIYDKAIGGVISKGWNSIKELFNTQYAGDKVYRQIAVKMTAGMLLEKSKTNGITKKIT